jgi:DNA polymerase III delta prime subunit
VFENIIGHAPLVAALTRELRADRFPRASLIHGPAYSGKSSLALEIARVLSCEADGAWGCGCRHCRQQRDLTYPFLLLLGWRYFDTDVRAAAATLRRVDSDGARFLFARAARRLTRRYDPVLWEGDESKLRSTGPLVAEINELVEDLLPPTSGSLPPQTSADASAEVAKSSARILELAAKLQAGLRSENIPISQLRNVEAWLHLSTASGRKVVIIEQAEGMGESSRNALLRLLEEPPRDTHIMLLTPRADALNATLRSRLREYAVPQRSPAEEQLVLGKIFRQAAADGGSLRDFFLGFHDPPPDLLRAAARRFVETVTSAAQTGPGGPTQLSYVPTQLSYVQGAGLPEPMSRQTFGALLEELTALLRPRSGEAGATVATDRWHVAMEWVAQIDHAQASVGLLRQQPGHVLQRLGAAMASSWAGGPSRPSDAQKRPRVGS